MDFRPYFKNCLEVKEEGEWIYPKRLTDKQTDYYEDNEGKLKRAFCTSGVALDFYSEATRLSFDYKIVKYAREFGSFDVYIDGVFTHIEKLENLKKGTINLIFPKGRKRITIYLPHLVCIYFKNFQTDSSPERVADNDKFLLCIGDSITQGMLAKNPSLTFPVLLSRFLGCDMLNMGVGGEVFDVNYLDKAPREPDIITLAFGCNDWTRISSIKELKENVRAFVNKLTLLYKCRNIYGVVPIWRSDQDEDKNAGISFEDVRTAISEVYSEYSHINIVDGYKLMPKIASFYGDEGDLKAHPTDEGFLYYAMNLLKYISGSCS